MPDASISSIGCCASEATRHFCAVARRRRQNSTPSPRLTPRTQARAETRKRVASRPWERTPEDLAMQGLIQMEDPPDDELET